MGATIGAIGGGLVNTLFGFYQNERNRERNIDAQNEAAQTNRDWQTVEAEKARQFSAEQQQKAMDYNSPVYQANEFKKAGINPVLALQGGSGVASVNGGSSSPSASPVSGLSPVQGQPVGLNIPEAVQSMGAFLKSIADAKKSGIETDYMEQTFFDAVSKFHNEQTLSTLEVASKEMDNYIKNRVKDAKVQQAWEELDEVGTRVVLNQASANESFSRSDLNKAMERMNDALARYHGENALYLKLQVQNFYRDFESLLNLRASEVKRNRTQADVNTSIKKLNDFQSEVNRNMQGAIEGSLFDSWQNLVKEGKILNWQIDAARSAAQIAGVQASHAEVLFWKDFITDIFDSGFSAFLGYKNAKSWDRLSKSSRDRVAARLEELKWEYGDKVEITSPTSTGGKKVRTYRRPYSKYSGSKD